MDVQQVRREALARVQARQRPPEFRMVRAGGSEARMQVAGGPGEYLGPAGAGEWLDDKIVRTPPQLGPWTAALYEVAGAARDGAAAAVAAVRSARALSEWDQWHMYVTLRAWRADPLCPVPVFRAVLAEWERLGLAAEEPSDVPLPVRPPVNAATLSDPRRRRPAVVSRPACLDGVA